RRLHEIHYHRERLERLVPTGPPLTLAWPERRARFLVVMREVPACLEPHNPQLPFGEPLSREPAIVLPEAEPIPVIYSLDAERRVQQLCQILPAPARPPEAVLAQAMK